MERSEHPRHTLRRDASDCDRRATGTRAEMHNIRCVRVIQGGQRRTIDREREGIDRVGRLCDYSTAVQAYAAQAESEKHDHSSGPSGEIRVLDGVHRRMPLVDGACKTTTDQSRRCGVLGAAAQRATSNMEVRPIRAGSPNCLIGLRKGTY